MTSQSASFTLVSEAFFEWLICFNCLASVICSAENEEFKLFGFWIILNVQIGNKCVSSEKKKFGANCFVHYRGQNI